MRNYVKPPKQKGKKGSKKDYIETERYKFNRFLSYTKKFPLAKVSSHGIAIVFDERENSYVKDPAKFTCKALTVDCLIDSLVEVWQIYEIKVTV